MKWKYLLAAAAVVVALSLAVMPAFGLESTSTTDSTQTVITPTPTAGQPFDVPVVVPGISVVVTFTLDSGGRVSSALVAGAPTGAETTKTASGVKISFQDNGITKVIEVNLDVETRGGQIVEVKAETEVEKPESADHKDGSEDNDHETLAGESHEKEKKADVPKREVSHDTEVSHSEAVDTKTEIKDSNNHAPELPDREDSQTPGGDSQPD